MHQHARISVQEQSKRAAILPPGTKRVYLIRHAQAWDGSGKTTIDPELTEVGIQQTEHLRKHFASLPLDAIVTTELTRARQTAEVLSIDRNHLEFLIKPGLNEAHVVGNWQELTAEDATRFATTPLYNPDDICLKGESIRMIRRRIKQAWEEILSLNYQNIAVVAHNGVISLLIGQLFGIEEGELVPIVVKLPNASISELHIRDTRGHEILPDHMIVVRYLSCVGHLPADLITD